MSSEKVHYRYPEVATKKVRERTIKEISILLLHETATILFVKALQIAEGAFAFAMKANGIVAPATIVTAE